MVASCSERRAACHQNHRGSCEGQRRGSQGHRAAADRGALEEVCEKRLHKMNIWKWLTKCHCKWEPNIYKGWECVEERCIKCNDHQHKTESGWRHGRIPKDQRQLNKNCNYKMETTKEIKCTCQAFNDAQLAGTDNEAYGALIRFWDGEWKAGCDLPPITFCPWCGKSLNKDHTK